ncbi:uncharacterized protein LOC141826958 [Curcuma longa]|uniref:uncharacterized protein LOC141826958 n=1 Tax=Curcuma longa TaxID=136217 RepID=UPI003D9EFEA7
MFRNLYILGLVAAALHRRLWLPILSPDKGEKYEGELLPHDLLLEIFSYLPAKKILQLQLLSKSFRRLAADPRFRLLQSQRNLAASGVFIYDPFDGRLDLFLLNHAAGFPLPQFLVRFLQVVFNDALLIVSSRGLLFYRHRGGDNFLVVNPACNDVRMIPAPPEGCSDMPYKGLAVKFLDDDDHLKCKYQLVYLRTTNAWSSLYQLCLYDSAVGEWIVDDWQVDLGSPFLNLRNLVVFKGSVFVASNLSSRVAAIDTSTKLVDFLQVPDSVSQGDGLINMAVCDEASGERSWLCLVYYNNLSGKFTLWRWLKGSIWVKFSEVVVDGLRCGNEEDDFTLCDGGTMNGLLLFLNTNGNQAYRYSFNLQQFIKLETKTGIFCRRFLAYSNSLRPC